MLIKTGRSHQNNIFYSHSFWERNNINKNRYIHPNDAAATTDEDIACSIDRDECCGISDQNEKL